MNLLLIARTIRGRRRDTAIHMGAPIIGRFLDEKESEDEHGHGEAEDGVVERPPSGASGEHVSSRQCRDGSETQGALSM